MGNLPAALQPARTARAMTADEIEDAITRYVTTAQLAIAAGFDGVQLHAAHGYLMYGTQCASPCGMDVACNVWCLVRA